eukprot:2012903-Amphidinium_carterae.1
MELNPSSKEITPEGKPVEMELELDMERKKLTPEDLVTPQWRCVSLVDGTPLWTHVPTLQA